MKIKILIGAFISFCLLFLTYCKETPTTPEIPEKPLPVINSFTATPSTIASGSSSKLEWNTTNADSVNIDNRVGGVSTSGIKYVYQEVTTTYTLTATNTSGSKTATCTVEVKAAKLEVVGTIKREMTSYNRPVFEGYVKNNGDNTAWNATITIYCYGNTAKTILIDTAWDYLADGNDIQPGVKTTFRAVAFDLSSHDQIKAITIELDWLEKDISGMSVSDYAKVEQSQRRWNEIKIKEARMRTRNQTVNFKTKL